MRLPIRHYAIEYCVWIEKQAHLGACLFNARRQRSRKCKNKTKKNVCTISRDKCERRSGGASNFDDAFISVCSTGLSMWASLLDSGVSLCWWARRRCDGMWRRIIVAKDQSARLCLCTTRDLLKAKRNKKWGLRFALYIITFCLLSWLKRWL